MGFTQKRQRFSWNIVQKQETASEKAAHGCNNPMQRLSPQLLFRLYYHLILSSKQRDVNEGSHVQREAYVNVTSQMFYSSQSQNSN